MFVKQDTNVWDDSGGLDGPARPAYLDCAATTQVDPAVAEVVMQYMVEEFGNAGSRTHEYGATANKAIKTAREQIGVSVAARADDVVFTSGATEADNLAILGLSDFGNTEGRRHIVSTQIEHKAVLEPLEEMERRGFEVTLLPPNRGGWVEPHQVLDAVRSDTLLVSVMHVNNETGVIQPIDEIAELLGDHPAYLHTDAAQGFGKDPHRLQHPRLDLISVSGHKIHAPKGIGALVVRRRGGKRVRLSPLMHGGGQERGLRPGTLPVHLAVGFGAAAELALATWEDRQAKCQQFKQALLLAMEPLSPIINGDIARTVPNIINLSLEGLDSEAAMLSLKELVAISNGSACTSQSYESSHVLLAMGLSKQSADTALRWSWCHLSDAPDWPAIVQALRNFR